MSETMLVRMKRGLGLTVVPLMIPVVAIRNLRPRVCLDIHLSAAISVYVHPPRKNTTVVFVASCDGTFRPRQHASTKSYGPKRDALASDRTSPSTFWRTSTVAPGIVAKTSSKPFQPTMGWARGTVFLSFSPSAATDKMAFFWVTH